MRVKSLTEVYCEGKMGKFLDEFPAMQKRENLILILNNEKSIVSRFITTLDTNRLKFCRSIKGFRRVPLEALTKSLGRLFNFLDIYA